MTRRVLVIGGAGVFGARLVAGLLRTTTFDVIVGGRHATPPRDHPRLSSLLIDATRVTPGQLRATGAFAIIDAAGPFQGAEPHLARIAIAAGLHCIDLADARDYIDRFPALDDAARAAGIVALTGASSTPALSNAALDALTVGWRQVDSVEIAISPGNRAPRGLSVVRAILAYTGQPVRVFIDGGWATRPGWGMNVRRTMPGLGRRWLALAETPDLDIVPRRFAVRHAAVFRAGLELPVLHLGLWLASLAVRARILPTLAPLARPVRAIAGWFQRWGTDRGGMTVQATGLDAAGAPARATWWLLAESGDGPAVPTLPALAALRALDTIPPGARACAGVLNLEAIEAEMQGLQITTGRRSEAPPPSLYERVLGDAFAVLPAPLQHLHGRSFGIHAAGVASVDGPDTALARLAAAVFRFPPAAKSVPVRVTIRPDEGRERWLRDFGGRRFASTLSAAGPGRLVERFGPFRFGLDLPVGPAGVLGMPVRAWWFGPIPLPRLLAPVSIATETMDEAGRFRFDVEMRLPLGLGRLVRYRGWLAPYPFAASNVSNPASIAAGLGGHPGIAKST